MSAYNKLKPLRACSFVVILSCTITLTGIMAYQARRYHDEKAYFNENNAVFNSIIPLAIEHKTPGCTIVDVDDAIAQIIEPDQIHVCYDDNLAIKFLWVGSKNPGLLYCYIPNAKKSDDVPFAESAYTTQLYAELPNHWFLCNSANREKAD